MPYQIALQAIGGARKGSCLHWALVPESRPVEACTNDAVTGMINREQLGRCKGRAAVSLIF